MKWFRRNIRTGSRLALFALALQFALSFGHFHFDAAKAAPDFRTQSDLVQLQVQALPADATSQAQQQPASHDNDQTSHEPCAICAVLSLAGSMVFSTPPLLLLPDALEFLYLATLRRTRPYRCDVVGIPVPRPSRFLTIDRRRRGSTASAELSRGHSEIGPSLLRRYQEMGQCRILTSNVLLATGASWLALGAAALAQGAPAALPDVNVTAPSPIVKRKPAVVRVPARVARATSGTARGPAPQAQPAPTAPVPQQGVLPVVTDQFATVTVVPNEELRRSGGATLGDLLFSKPGITGSSFAPGASSRPIIRGLDVNRVGIVENGIGARRRVRSRRGSFRADRSARHQPGRGDPRTGDTALRLAPRSAAWSARPTTAFRKRCRSARGAVPELRHARRPIGGCSVAPCITAETRTAVSTVDRGLEGGVLLDAGGGNFAVPRRRLWPQVDRLPHPELSLSVRPDRAPSTDASRTRPRRPTAQSIGGSYIFDGGFIGAAVTQNNSLYRIPGIDGDDHRHADRRAPDQADGQGRIPRRMRRRSTRCASGRGATDYKHNEIGLADPADLAIDGVRQTFTNKEQEGRVEVQLAPFNLRFAALTTALGRAGRASGADRAEPGRSGHAVQRTVGPEQQHARRRLHLQRVQVHARRPRRRSPAASSMSTLHGTTPSTSRRTTSTRRHAASRRRAQSHLHAEERQHRPDPEPAVGSRRQHHRAICRARAEAGRTVLARRA